jgi:formylglycine-generating enzyme required for sulfatase activity
MVLVVVPPGEFLMGTPPAESGRTPSEGPQHVVKLTSAILVGRYEVTQEEYSQLMGQNPSFSAATGAGRPSVVGQDTARFPVENVSWFDACEFCNRLSRHERLEEFYQVDSKQLRGGHIVQATISIHGGRGYRLPTEAEFEYFSRAGTLTPFFFGSVHDGTQGNVMGTRPYGTSQAGPFLNRPTTVGSYAPNAFGIFDVDGNVGEWCWDRFDPNYYSRFQKTPARDPLGPDDGSKRVMRSCSSQYEPVYARSGRRHADDPALATGWTGFRVVRNAE